MTSSNGAHLRITAISGVTISNPFASGHDLDSITVTVSLPLVSALAKSGGVGSAVGGAEALASIRITPSLSNFLMEPAIVG
jgi:hypothetical protein